MMKRVFIIIAVFIFTLSACAAPSEPEPPPEYIKITPEEASDMMNSGNNVIILDVRTQEEYDAGYIENAVLLPYDEIGEKAQSIIPDKSSSILIYCRRGRRSEIAARELLEMGYTKVYDFGGVENWGDDAEAYFKIITR